jgi:antirestriction protein ArdC
LSSAVYQAVTDRIVRLLESGVVPWQKSWTVQCPRNLVSGKPYRGINLLLLNSLGYSSPYFLTYNQSNLLGGHVKQGQKGTPVVFWKFVQVKAPELDLGVKTVPLLRYYTVFNVSQCDDIPASKIPQVTEIVRIHSPIEAAEQIVAAMPKKPQIQHGKPRAAYSPTLDRVEMPGPESFQKPEDYYSVLFHELTHATGHEKRLNRKGVTGSAGGWTAFGSPSYAKEELVAELGSSFLSGEAGITDRTIHNSAAYIGSWLQRLKDDSKLVVHAAGRAQKASDYILNRLPKEQEAELPLAA